MLNCVRSLFLNIVLFFYFVIALTSGMIAVFAFRLSVYKFWNLLSQGFYLLTKNINGINFKVINKNKIKNTPAIYVIRHESAWEPLVLIHLFKQPIFILKKELLNIPLFGALAKAAKVIAIDRSQGVKSLIKITKSVEDTLNKGHPIIIFPEGTRANAGEHIPIKRGISMFYKKTQYSIIPIIHNAGSFWSKHSFIKKPGTITVKVLDPIQKDLSTEEFMNTINKIFYDEIELLKTKKD